LAYLPAGALIGLLLLASPRARLVFIVFGGLLIFQSSQQLDSKKMAFLLGACIVLVGALVRSQRFMRSSVFADMRPLFLSSAAFAALLTVSLPVAKLSGVPTKDWLRDVAPYVLFACAPIFALDAATSLPARTLRRLVAIAGFLGAASFATRWISHRGIANLKSEAVGLPTFLLGAAVFAYGMAIVLEGHRGRLRWLVLTALILAMLVSTGTRSTAVLLAAPLAIVVGTRERFARRAVRLGIALPMAALLVFLGTQSLVQLVNANHSRLQDRVQTLFSTGHSKDRSYVDRVRQTRAAWNLFKEKPLLGTGPGYSINWEDFQGLPHSSPSIDSSLAYLSKFGALGLLPVAVFIWAYASFMGRIRRRTGGRTVAQLALIGYAAVIAAWAVLDVPFEDKGLSSGLLLLFALGASEAESMSAETATAQ
jgi:O-antigen ligase